jgi:hypothetical protein
MPREYIKRGYTDRYRTSAVRQSGFDIVKVQNRVKKKLKKQAKTRKQEALDNCYQKGISEGKEAADKKAADKKAADKKRKRASTEKQSAAAAISASALPSSPPTAVITIYDTPTKRQKLVEDAGISHETASTLTSPQVTSLLFFIDRYNNSLV